MPSGKASVAKNADTGSDSRNVGDNSRGSEEIVNKISNNPFQYDHYH